MRSPVKYTALLLAIGFASILSAQDLKKETYSLGPWEQDIGYTQAIRVGNTLHISGSVGWGTMPEAVEQAFGTIKQTLAHYGLDFRHVVKENAYTTDIEALKAAQDVRKVYYGTDFPATTWVQVNRLYMPEAVLEVEVIAVFPDAAPATPAPAKPSPWLTFPAKPFSSSRWPPGDARTNGSASAKSFLSPK